MKLVFSIAFLFISLSFCRLSANPTNFIENRGQWQKEVKYFAEFPGYNVWVTENGIRFDYYSMERISKKNENTLPDFLSATTQIDSKHSRNDTLLYSGNVIDMRFEGGSVSSVRQLQKAPGVFNYFRGQDSSKWASHVPWYREVVLKEVYKGIDVRLYNENNAMRYDFIVQPGADPSQIKLNFTGQKGLAIESNQIVLSTIIGDKRHGSLMAYQKTNHSKNKIECNFNKISNGSIQFALGNYDKSKELIIDPDVIITYLGLSGSTFIDDVLLDEDGYVYCAGSTTNEQFPTTTGAYKAKRSNADEGFITCFTPDLCELVFSTIFGADTLLAVGIRSIVRDKDGNIYIAGGTTEGLPVTENAFKQKMDTVTFNSDQYLAKFNPDCSKLLYCSYFGGREREEFVGVKLQIDNSGSIYLSGITRSTDLPVTANAWRKAKLHPSVDRHDIYIAKFNKKLDSLEYCTYFGTDYPDSYALTQIDDNGCLVLSGSTMNKTFTTTEDVYRNAFNSHHSTYISKLNQNGSNFVFSTFICGENGKDYDGTRPDDIYRTKSGDIYMIGNTQRGLFPLDYDVIFDKTPNSYDENITFIARIDTLGRDVLYSAIMKRWASYAKLRVSDNFIYIGWNPYILSYPITLDAYQNELKGTSSAGFMVLSLDMKQIIYSTPLGGSINQEVLDMDINNSGEAVLSGWTLSPDFPTTSGVYQESVLGVGPYYGFVAKFRFPTGVNEQPKEVNGYNLYPNPAHSGETVCISTHSELFSANAAVTLYNSIGKEISDIRFVNYGTKFEFAANSLSSGIYFIKIRNNNTEQTIPFAVIK